MRGVGDGVRAQLARIGIELVYVESELSAALVIERGVRRFLVVSSATLGTDEGYRVFIGAMELLGTLGAGVCPD